jgi:hypothetical protein
MALTIYCLCYRYVPLRWSPTANAWVPVNTSYNRAYGVSLPNLVPELQDASRVSRERTTIFGGKR